MTTVTYYVVIPYSRSDEGDLVQAEPMEAQSRHAAMRLAAQVAAGTVGAVAFSRTGDPATGDFEPAQWIVRHGETPDEVD